MRNRHFIQGSLLLAAATGGTLAQAAVIDFETLTGPSTYLAAGARRDLDIGGVLISGGTVLSQETFLPANRTTLYGTAFFGSTVAPAPPYSPTMTIDFRPLNTQVTSFYLDVYNGQVFNVTYTLADNNGNSASFVLAPNLASGTTKIGFAPSGTVVTLTSDAGNFWDFSIDNIVYNQGLPADIPTQPSQVQPPPPVTNTPPVTLVSVDVPPPPPTLTIEQRQAEGLDEQDRRRKQKGKNGADFRLEAQGFDDRLVAPAPVPVPASLPLLGGALAGLAGWSRRRRA